MVSRNLKYYTWGYEKGNIYLISKKTGSQNEMILNMAMADSFVRAYISFKNKNRLEEKMALRKAVNLQKERLQEKVNNLLNKLKGNKEV